MQGQQLENMRQGVERDKVKAENKQKRAEKAKLITSVKAVGLENEARAFSTYAAFPIEELRETLLEKVR